jgi:DNA-binding response OmpR family regulator
MSVRVLVVEDARQLADAIADGLRGQAMAVDVVFDGQAALDRLGINDYDVVILDRDLPVVHGDEVCRSLAAGGATVRILMLTAAGDLSERVTGLNLGADDYMISPSSERESGSTRCAMRRPGRAARCRYGTRSSSSWKNCCGPRGRWCPLSSCLRKRGMRTSTRLPTWSGSR